MRLLHTRELRFQEFFNDSIPTYAILSHRWVDEVSYQEFLYLNRQQWAGGQVFVPIIVADDSRRDCSGFRKVMNFRDITAADGYDWVWVDTVCIDKTSSAELSEAINSMYRWYSCSDKCYVYLSDVLREEAGGLGPRSFAKSEWFNRGWTLQELIAPHKVVFRDAVWGILGDKTDLQALLYRITHIPTDILRDPSNVYTLSTAERLSLAVGRKTSRLEDRAYSLLGLFDVSMPLLYGEGNEAFRRLQRSILPKNFDESIFAHRGVGLLADSVDDFAFHKKTGDDPAEKEQYQIWRHESKYLFLSDSMLQGDLLITPHYRGVRMVAACLLATDLQGMLIVLRYVSNRGGLRLLKTLLHVSVNVSEHAGLLGWTKSGTVVDGVCGCDLSKKKNEAGRKPCEQLAQIYQDNAPQFDPESIALSFLRNTFPSRIRLRYRTMYIE